MTKLTEIPKDWQKVSVPWLIYRNLHQRPKGHGNRAKRRIEALKHKGEVHDFILTQIFRRKGLAKMCSILNRHCRDTKITVSYGT